MMQNNDKKGLTTREMAEVIARKQGWSIWNAPGLPICIGNHEWLEDLKRRWGYEAN